MRCLDCKSQMEEIEVKVDGSKNKVLSYQCPNCGHFEFEKTSSNLIIDELRMKEVNSPLKTKQKIIKLSKGRIGMYFNQDVVRSIHLEAGKEVYVSVPDKKHIILKLEDK